ncbi:hypothetical protein [Pseudovibrio brasiliensis]|nr:hypothetical protein [Pseudovibrio brasiliensis]
MKNLSRVQLAEELYTVQDQIEELKKYANKLLKELRKRQQQED